MEIESTARREKKRCTWLFEWFPLSRPLFLLLLPSLSRHVSLYSSATTWTTTMLDQQSTRRARSPPPTASSWSPTSSSPSLSSASTDPFSSVPSYACKRLSPYPCVNQPLVNALAPLREYRFVVYGSEYLLHIIWAIGNSSWCFLVVLTAAEPEAISYATAVSTIIGCPVKIESVEQAKRLPKVSPSFLQ